MCGLSALRASGRLSVIVAVCPSTSYLMVSNESAGMRVPFLPTRSPTTELWRASLLKRCQSLFEIACPTGQFQVEKLLCHGLAQRRVLTEAEGLLGQPDRYRGAPGQPLQQLLCGVVEFGSAYRLVDQSPVGRVRRAHF